jgi:small-conductance mechanosensitive channel
VCLWVAPLGAAPDAPHSETEVAQSAKVVLADQEVFRVRAPLANKSAAERAQLASKALAAAARESELGVVSIVAEGTDRVVYVNRAPIVRLSELDAELDGDASLEAHARGVAADIERALEAEHRRGQIAQKVFSVSLVVFFGLLAFFLMRRVSALTERVQHWVEENEEKLTLRIRDVEVVRSEMIQSASIVVLGVARWLGMGAVLYAWVVASLSLFGLTAVTQKLTGMVVSPLSQLTARVATTVPLLVLGLIAGLSVLLLLRFVELLFAGVAKRETTLAWVPADLALPTSVLLRIGIVLAALLFAAPVVTGDPGGPFPRVGLVLLAALGLGSVPLVASMLVGVVVLFGRRLRLHDRVRLGSLEGRVVGLDLLEVRLHGAAGEERIPMLSLLREPLTKLDGVSRVTASLPVALTADLERVELELRLAATEVLDDVVVSLALADRDGLVFDVSGRARGEGDHGKLLSSLVLALQRSGIALGRMERLPQP